MTTTALSISWADFPSNIRAALITVTFGAGDCAVAPSAQNVTRTRAAIAARAWSFMVMYLDM